MVKETNIYCQGMIVYASQTQIVFTIDNASDNNACASRFIRLAESCGSYKLDIVFVWQSCFRLSIYYITCKL